MFRQGSSATSEYFLVQVVQRRFVVGIKRTVLARANAGKHP